jgi:transposase
LGHQIALGVDRRGLPLRWEVFASSVGESARLSSWLDALDELPPLNTVPLVFDRGFSTHNNLAELVRRKRLFVTCARQPQLIDWSDTIDFASIARTPSGKRPSAKLLRTAGLTSDDEDSDLFYLDQGVRTPYSSTIALPKMRVVLFFRPSQYAFDTKRTEETRKRLFNELDEINADLAGAKNNRKKTSTLERIKRQLRKRHMECDYKPHLIPITVKAPKGKTVSSFQIELQPLEYTKQKRDYNAGWRVLLANPKDTRSATKLIRLYDNKHLVEHAFRTIKSFVDLRPVRHQTTSKIKAHVTLCVLGMLIDRWLELRLRERRIRDAVDRVYETLEPCRLIVFAPKSGTANRLQVTDVEKPQRRLLSTLGMQDLAETAPFDVMRPRRY